MKPTPFSFARTTRILLVAGLLLVVGLPPAAAQLPPPPTPTLPPTTLPTALPGSPLQLDAALQAHLTQGPLNQYLGFSPERGPGAGSWQGASLLEGFGVLPGIQLRGAWTGPSGLQGRAEGLLEHMLEDTLAADLQGQAASVEQLTGLDVPVPPELARNLRTIQNIAGIVRIDPKDVVDCALRLPEQQELLLDLLGGVSGKLGEELDEALEGEELAPVRQGLDALANRFGADPDELRPSLALELAYLALLGVADSPAAGDLPTSWSELLSLQEKLQAGEQVGPSPQVEVWIATLQTMGSGDPVGMAAVHKLGRTLAAVLYLRGSILTYLGLDGIESEGGYATGLTALSLMKRMYAGNAGPMLQSLDRGNAGVVAAKVLDPLLGDDGKGLEALQVLAGGIDGLEELPLAANLPALGQILMQQQVGAEFADALAAMELAPLPEGLRWGWQGNLTDPFNQSSHTLQVYGSASRGGDVQGGVTVDGRQYHSPASPGELSRFLANPPPADPQLYLQQFQQLQTAMSGGSGGGAPPPFSLPPALPPGPGTGGGNAAPTGLSGRDAAGLVGGLVAGVRSKPQPEPPPEPEPVPGPFPRPGS